MNGRGDGSWATLTQKSEMENYLHADVIRAVFDISVAFGDHDDVPMLVARALHEGSDSDTSWDQLDEEKKKKKESSVKRRLNDEVASFMTYTWLLERDPAGEIESWLRKIATLLS